MIIRCCIAGLLRLDDLGAPRGYFALDLLDKGLQRHRAKIATGAITHTDRACFLVTAAYDGHVGDLEILGDLDLGLNANP